MNILKALKRSSLGIDFYLWLTYRTFTLKRPLRLSWVCLYRQFGVKPVKAGDNRTVDNFRTDCLRELKKIKVAWPESELCGGLRAYWSFCPRNPLYLPMWQFQLVE